MKLSKSALILFSVLGISVAAMAAPICHDILGDGSAVVMPTSSIAQLIEHEFTFTFNPAGRTLLDRALDLSQEPTPAVRHDFTRMLEGMKWDFPSLTKQAGEELGRRLSREQAVALRLTLRIPPEQTALRERILDLAGLDAEERIALLASDAMDDDLANNKAFNLFNIRPANTAEEAKLRNEDTFRAMDRQAELNLANNKPAPGRKVALNAEEAQALYEKLALHPIARLAMTAIYDFKTKGSVGFCFGRATVAHIEALRAGVDKRSIRKLWVLGAMEAKFWTKKMMWQYHVATAVQAEGGGWWVIDPELHKPVKMDEWTQKWVDAAPNHKTLVYATEAGRLFPSTFYRYAKMTLDYYPKYFGDVMKYYRKVSQDPSAEKKSLLQKAFNFLMRTMDLNF